MKNIALIVLSLVLSACTTLNVADPSHLLAQGGGGPSGVSSSGGATPPPKLGSVIIPQQAGDFWVNQTASSPFAIKDGSGNTRVQFETTKGRATFGGSGTDSRVVVGPYTGSATNPSIYLLDNASTAGANNYALWGDGANLIFNTIASSGSFDFYNANSSLLSRIKTVSGSQDVLWLGHAVVPSATNYSLISDASSFSAVNFPSAGYFGIISANATYVAQFAGGTQGGIALGSTVAPVGHLRGPAGFLWQNRNSTNTGNNVVFQDDGANNVNQGSGYNTWTMGANNFNIVAATQIAIEGGTDQYYDSGTHHYRSAAHTEYLSLTAAAAALFQFNATNATSGTIGWTGGTAAAGNSITILGQTAGGTNDGGQVILTGGTHSGAAKADGSVRITTPLSGGFLSTTVAGNTTLTNAQSNANFVLLTSVSLGPFTLTFEREITDPGNCVWIKNAGANPVQISYIGGSTVTINNATSALVCSDGSAALQKIMTGTRLDPLDLKRWSPVPENDNARPAVAEKEAA